MSDVFYGLSSALLLQQVNTDDTMPDLLKQHVSLIPRRLHKYLIDRARLTADSFRVSVTDYEDLFQECLIAMWKATIRFNPVMGIPYDHYANTAISNVLNSLRDRAYHITMLDRVMSDLIGDMDVDTLSVVDAASEDAYDTIRVTLLMVDFVKTLTPVEREVLHFELREFTSSEIAKHVAKSPSTISATSGRIRAKFVLYCADNDLSYLLPKGDV